MAWLYRWLVQVRRGQPRWGKPVVWVARGTGPILAVGGAIAVLISLSLPWFVTTRLCALRASPLFPCPHQAVHFSGWEAFQTADIALAALAGVAIVLTFEGPPVARSLAPIVGVTPAFAIAIVRLSVAAVGWSVVALSLYAVHRPGLPFDPSRVPDFGFFVSLLAGGAITGGGWWSVVAGAEPPDPSTRDQECPAVAAGSERTPHETPAAEAGRRGETSRLWLLVWTVPAVLFGAAVYELALILWGSYGGLEPGQSSDGEATVTSVAWMAMLVGVFVAAVHAVRPRLPSALAFFAPAAMAFVIARFYTYDPYYFPTLRRYSEGRGPGAGEWIVVMVALSIAVGVWSRLRPRSGSVATAFVLPLLLFTSALLSDGH